MYLMIILSFSLYVDAIVGFEQFNYTVRETDGSSQVCVIVVNPPSDVELTFVIYLGYETRTGTAGKFNQV